MTIQELYDARAKAWEAAKNFLDTHGTGGSLSAEDAQTYDRMEKEIKEITAQINRQQRLDAIAAEMAAPTSAPILGRPGGSPEDSQTGRGSRQYRNDMLTAFRSNFMTITDALNEGTDSAGGYLVPDEWDSRLIEKLAEDNIMRRLGTVIRTKGEHRINIAATDAAAHWTAEGGNIQFEDATFDQKNLDAHKLVVAVKVTEELLYDNAYDLESHLINSFGRATDNEEEDKFLNGTGVGQPTGIFNATNGGTKSTATTGTNGAIKAEDVFDLIYSLKRPYRRKAQFIMNDKTMAALRKLKDGNQAFIWQPSYQAGEPDRLAGFPVNTSAYCPEMPAAKPAKADGDAPFMAFGDFSYYNIGDRGTRSVRSLRELFAGNGMVAFMMTERVDGILVLPEAVQLMYMEASTT